MVTRIVSGGQTGADRAALDVAIELGLEIGGWIPRGRLAEDGVVPERYAGLVETPSDAYRVRTEWNVRDADATIVLGHGPPFGGTALTVEIARALGRPHLVVDLDTTPVSEAARRLRGFVERTRPRVLNVAGPRASEDPAIEAETRAVLRAALGGAPPP